MTIDSLAEFFPKAAGAYDIPGASLAISIGDVQHDFHAGVTSLESRIPVVSGTAFQIGSNTKMLTAALVFTLLEDGLLSLSDPVSQFIPEVAALSRASWAPITITHLLAHTSGLEGDLFLDKAPDDCLEEFLRDLLQVAPVLPPGELFSYCNSGYNLLGLIAERLTGQSWAVLIQERILAPLELSSAQILNAPTGEGVLAYGHVRKVSGELGVAERQFFPPAFGPSGASIVMSAADLAGFGRAFLACAQPDHEGGVIRSSSAQKMARRQVEVPGFWVASGWGLGVSVSQWGDSKVIGHGGVTIGQYSYFDMLPEQGVVMVLMTNGGDAAALRKDIYDHILPGLIGAGMPPAPPVEPGSVPALKVFAGEYGTATRLISVRENDGTLVIHNSPTIESPWVEPPSEVSLSPVRESLFVARLPPSKQPSYACFGGEAGAQHYLHFGGRAYLRRA